MKYKIGPIAFKGKKSGDMIPRYFTEEKLLSEYIIHGGTYLHKDYNVKFAEIVDYYKKFYVVKFKSTRGSYTQIGFLEKDLEPVPNNKTKSGIVTQYEIC
jgi:hypothetical protein